MEELYIQDFGRERIVKIVGWNKEDVMLEDLFTECRYALNWDNFNKYHKKLEYNPQSDEYTGVDLDRILKD